MHLHLALPKGTPPFCLMWARQQRFICDHCSPTPCSAPLHLLLIHGLDDLAFDFRDFYCPRSNVGPMHCRTATNQFPTSRDNRSSVCSRHSVRLWLQSLSINSLNVRRGGWTDESTNIFTIQLRIPISSNFYCPSHAKPFNIMSSCNGNSIYDNVINVNCPADIPDTKKSCIKYIVVYVLPYDKSK